MKIGFAGEKEGAFLSYDVSTQQYKLSLPDVKLGGSPLSIDLRFTGGRLSGGTKFQIGSGKGEISLDEQKGLMLSYNNEKGIPWSVGVGLNQYSRLNLFFDYEIDRSQKLQLSLGGTKPKLDAYFYRKF